MKTKSHSTSARFLLAALSLLVAACLPSRLAAQLDRGEITGTVEDPQGAMVPKATIVLANDDTGVKATTKSTSTGTYVFDDLLPGKYTVEADAPGSRSMSCTESSCRYSRSSPSIFTLPPAMCSRVSL